MNAKQQPYDDYYYEEMPNSQSVFESNQKSIMVFLVHSSVALQRSSEQLRVLNSETVPDLQAFASLGFPLKQTLKVKLTER